LSEFDHFIAEAFDKALFLPHLLCFAQCAALSGCARQEQGSNKKGQQLDWQLVLMAAGPWFVICDL
jgi:hypothetical protein